MNFTNIQNIFYIVGIVFMSLYTILLIVVIILLFYIKSKIAQFTQTIEERIGIAKDLVLRPAEVAGNVGAAVATTAINKATQFIRNQRNKRNRDNKKRNR